MLRRGQTTEQRIGEIANKFAQGIGGYAESQMQEAKGMKDERQYQDKLNLAEEAKKRQYAIQETEIEGKLSEQTGKNLLGSGVGKKILAGYYGSLGDIFKKAEPTRKAIKEDDEKVIKAEERALNAEYKRSLINKNNSPKTSKAETVGGVRLKPNEIDKFNEGNQIPSMLSDVQNVINQNADEFGPVKGRLGALNPYNEKAQTIESSMRTSAQAFGKYMEGGMLRAEDEVKYRKMFPSQEDTPEVAKNKLDLVNRLLVERQQSTVEALKKGGYDTSPIEKTLLQTAQPKVISGNQNIDMSVIKATPREEKIKFLKGLTNG